MKGLRDFLKGGWRVVPEGERWWEEVLVILLRNDVC